MWKNHRSDSKELAVADPGIDRRGGADFEKMHAHQSCMF